MSNQTFDLNVLNSVMPMDVRKVNNVLDALGTYERGRIHEDQLRDRFLAFFCGKTPPDLSPALLNAWYQVSGGPSTEVDVVNSANQIVTVVPALFTNDIDLFKTRGMGVSFGEIINTAALESNNIAQLAVANLRRSLHEKAIQQKASAIKDNSKQLKWLNLFNYFGCYEEAKIMQGELDGIASTSLSYQSANSNTDEFVFD